MKIICSYTVLLGMLLMYIPKTFVHECKNHSHKQICNEHSNHSSKDSNSLVFEQEECQICSLEFDVLDLPSDSFIENQLQRSSRSKSVINDPPFTVNLNSLNSRGPPIFIAL